MSRFALLWIAMAALVLQTPSTATAWGGASCHGKSPLRKLCDAGGPASGAEGGGGPASGAESGGGPASGAESGGDGGDDEPSSRSGDDSYDSSSITAGPNGASN
ncbi:hypothetical protein [Planomonospora algeriensis]